MKTHMKTNSNMDFVRSVLLIFAAVLIKQSSQDDYRLPSADLECNTDGFQIDLTYQVAKNDQYKQKNSWMIGNIAATAAADAAKVYTLYTEKMTWDAASKFCQDSNGNLASATNKEEEDAVKKVGEDHGAPVWIGHNDQAEENKYMWSTGENWTLDVNVISNTEEADCGYTHFGFFYMDRCSEDVDDKKKAFVCQSGAAGGCASKTDQEILHTTAGNDLKASPSVASYGTSASPVCNGNFDSNSNENIVYKTKFFVKIKETVREKSLRIYVYEWDLTCTLTRITTAEDTIGYQVITQNSGLKREGDIANEDDTFSLDVIIQFIDESEQPRDAVFSADNNEQVTFRVSGKNPSDDLKFTVQKCWASKSSTASNKDLIDEFIEDECGLDDTIEEMADTSAAEKYDFSVRAFYLEEGDAALSSKPTYVHCEAFVCYKDETGDVWDGKCVQENLATCKARRDNTRKRRSIEPEVEELLRTHTETSQQAFVLRDVFSPRCPSEYVYDTLSEDCTKDRVMSIKGVQLDLTWRPSYANASSTEFKQFADITASRILSLLRATGKEGAIRGVKIMKAEENNGVTLDVLITHSENVNADEGFATFKDVLYKTTPRATRVVNLLHIGQEKLIELVPVVPVVVATEKKSGLNTEILIIIIVAAVLVVMVIFAVTLCRFRKVREQPTKANTAYENNGMDKI